MPRAPAVTTIGKADLPSINQAIRKISQRLDFLDDQPLVSAAEVELLRRQLAALQARVQALPSAPAASSARNLFIQVAEPRATEPLLWIIPVTDDTGAVIDASLILRTP